jgi:hypothetical protein
VSCGFWMSRTSLALGKLVHITSFASRLA